MAIGMPFQGGMLPQQQQHPLIGPYDQFCSYQINPALVQQYGLGGLEQNQLVQWQNLNANQILDEFCRRFVDAGGGYDPNVLRNAIYKTSENFVVNQLRNPNRQQAALPNVSAFAALPAGTGSMDYYQAGSGLSTSQGLIPPIPQNTNTGYVQDQLPRRQTVQNPTFNSQAQPSSPTPKERPMAPVITQEEEPQGDISVSVDKLVACLQTEEEKQLMDVINSSKAQTCKSMFHFISDKTGDKYNFNHVKVHVPYSSKENAMMDIATAYPQLFDGKYATLMEFYTYVPMAIHFSQGKPTFDRLKDSLMKNPYALADNVLTQTLGAINAPMAEFISKDFIRMLNNVFGAYLSKVDAEGNVTICNIATLEDIKDLQLGTDPALTNFSKFESYSDHVLGCLKAVLDSYFHIQDPERMPYLRCEDEEMHLAASMEISGIRVGDYIGRDINLMQEENETVLKSIVDQLRKRTIGLKKHTVLFTNIECPDAKRMIKYGSVGIKKIRHPFHYIMQHLVENYPIDLYNIDLTESGVRVPVYANVGVSVNGFMVLRFADYDHTR